MTPKQFAASRRAVAAKVTQNILAAERQTVKEAMQAAAALSSGGYSTAQLKAAGHPYARRAPNPAFDAAIINVQTGRFRAAWKSQGPEVTIGGIVSKVTNNSPEAQFMAGTKTMIARPIGQAIQKAVEPSRQRRLARIRAAIIEGLIK